MTTKTEKRNFLNTAHTFSLLQRVGRSFMLPIALLPVAGLLLGIGSSFTNAAMLETYGLTGVLGEGTLLYSIFSILSAVGSVIFDNLPLLFAMGVALGMAENEKATATLSAAIAFFVMHKTINALLTITGRLDDPSMHEGTVAGVVGIQSLQMGVFGGIIVGLGVAWLHNRFYKIRLPDVLSFFGGTRFVPIISTGAYILVGGVMFFVWPYVQNGIYALGDLVLRTGYAGTLIYGFIERILIPFGLHHVFYLPFWQTGVGGSAVIEGTLVYGAQNIFFAELASPATEVFSVSATRFMSGKFPLMIFGLPGAALAMYACARPEKKKVAGSLLLSAALTSMLTGITEPIEFTFLFVAPVLYVIHSVLAGAAYMLMHMLNVGVGMTFSGGLIDLFLFGILQGNAKTNWIMVPLVGLGYFILYFFLFRFLIRRRNYMTPGREADAEETRLYTRADYNKKKENTVQEADTAGEKQSVSRRITEGLGGKDNIASLDCCATRLRVSVRDGGRVNKGILTETGAAGVIVKGTGVQVIYGPKVAVLKSELEEYLASDAGEESEPVSLTVAACAEGKVIPMHRIPDEAFSSGTLGVCCGIEPTDEHSECIVYAPAAGKIVQTAQTGHAVGLETPDGLEILLHAGIDTVAMGGDGFTMLVKSGDSVNPGQPVLKMDLEKVRKAGYAAAVVTVITNSDDWGQIDLLTQGDVKPGQPLFSAGGRRDMTE